MYNRLTFPIGTLIALLVIVVFSHASQQVPEQWLSEVKKNIAASEYSITQCGDQLAYQSPNRAQNLRIRYEADRFSLEPRVDSLERWNSQLQIVSITKGIGSLPVAQTLEIDRFIVRHDTLLVRHTGFDIQYVNNSEGMRQNFLVREKPRGEGSLRIRLAVSGTLQAIKKGDGDAVLSEWNDHLGSYQNRVWYKDLKVWDAKGRALAAGMEVSDEGKTIELVVNDAQAVYPVTVDPISTTAATVLNPFSANDEFGRVISSGGDINGDGYGDAVVGYASFNNHDGSVFVFYGSTSGLSSTPSRTLVNSSLRALGLSISDAGDVNGDGFGDIVVGASNVVCVLYGSSSGLSFSNSTIITMPTSVSYFGSRVCGVGDVDGDGFSDVAAQGYRHNPDSGMVFVFHGSASGVIVSATTSLASPNYWYGHLVNGAGDVNGDGYADIVIDAAPQYSAIVFGGSSTGVGTVPIAFIPLLSGKYADCLSSAGDVNGDGYGDLIAGMYSYTDDQYYEGIALVYHGSYSGMSTSAPAAVLAANQDTAYFGWSVAGVGDVNGDGYGDVVVGAPYFKNGTDDEGAAFLFLGGASGVSLTPAAQFEKDYYKAGFGADVDGGDVNGDGFSDILVGAFRNGARVYHGGPDGIDIANGWRSESNQTDARMGSSVAFAGDVNGDGYDDIAVGAPGFDNGQDAEGRVFVYHGRTIGPASTPTWTAEANLAGAMFGSSVARAGDVNNDGYGDLIVGAPGYSNGQSGEGRAFLYMGSSSGLSTTAAWTAESNQADAAFGSSVAGAGDVNGDGYADMLVGAPAFDGTGGTDEGQGYCFYGGTSLSTSPSWIAGAGQAGARFGISVAGAGDVNGDGYGDILIGARDFSNGNEYEGGVFAYYGGPAGLSEVLNWSKESNQAYARMGMSVACAGDINGDGISDIAIGAPNYTNGETNEGVVFIYHGSLSGGLSSTHSAMLELNMPSSQYGMSVAGAGDVNGDGYADLIVGAPGYTNVNNRGVIALYHGGTAGLQTSTAILIGGNVDHAMLGSAVAGAGDVNGDGFSDILAGEPFFAAGETGEGAVRLYYGNNGGGLRATTRQYRTDLITPLAGGGRSDVNGQVGLGLFARSPGGRQKGRMVYEYAPHDAPFSGTPITRSVVYTGRQTAYTNLGTSGTALSTLVSGILNQKAYKWRARIQYQPVSSLNGQVYGPWKYEPGYGSANSGFRSGAMPTLTAPTTQASNVLFSDVGATGMTVSWTRGNGSGVAVFMKQAPTGSAAPLRYATYAGDAVFGNGTQIGSSGWYCIYNGTGTSVAISGLMAGTEYRIMACEYAALGNYIEYLSITASGNPANQTTAATGPSFTIVPDQQMTESNLDSRYLNVTLDATSFVDNRLSTLNFGLVGAPAGCTIQSCVYTDATHCTVSLAYSGDFDNDMTDLDLTIGAFELTTGAALTSTNNLTILATNDAESIVIASDGTITEGSENGEVITVTISGGVFASTLNAANWTVANLPVGVTKGSVARVDATHAAIILSGNRTNDYDSDITNVTVSCTNAEYRDATGNGALSATAGITFTAVIEPASIAITPDSSLTEGSLNNRYITLTIDQDRFVDNIITSGNFTLTNAPTGCAIEGITYVDEHTCVIDLGFDCTDFDADIANFGITVAAAELTYGAPASSNQLTINATNDDESITMASDGNITEGAENGEIITITLTGGTFAATLTTANWTLANLPAGVTAGTVTRIDATHAAIALSGNRTVDYDSDITTLTVTCAADQYASPTGVGTLTASGTVVFTAVNEAITITIAADQPMTEANLDQRAFTVVIDQDMFADNVLDRALFALINAPAGCSVESAVYTDATHCTVNLAFDGSDFDTDIAGFGLAIAGAELAGGSNAASSNSLSITAENDPESITVSGDGIITEAAESGEVIIISLAGGTFSSALNADNWSVANLPVGVVMGAVTRIDATHAAITLSGNRSLDFDSDITTVTVSCSNAEYRDATGGGALTSTNGITISAVIEPPEGPVLTSPDDGAIDRPQTITLSWNPIAEAVGYHIQVASSADFNTPIINDSTVIATTRECVSLEAGTTFYWRVNARNTGGAGPWSAVRNFTTVPLPPPAPITIIPSENAAGVPVDIAFFWTRAERAINYRFQLSTGTDFSSPLRDTAGLTDTTLAINGLTNDTRYYWRICAANSGGNGPWTAERYFTTIVALPSSPSVIFPGTTDTLSVDSVVLSWHPATPAVSRYLIETSADSSMTGATIDSSITDTTLLWRNLPDKSIRWWRIRAGNAAGWGDWSAKRCFIIDLPKTATHLRGLPRVFSFSINDRSGFIRYALPEAGFVSIKIYSINGFLVGTLRNNMHQPGYYQVPINDGAIASGTYIVTFNSRKWHFKKRTFLLRQ